MAKKVAVAMRERQKTFDDDDIVLLLQRINKVKLTKRDRMRFLALSSLPLSVSLLYFRFNNVKWNPLLGCSSRVEQKGKAEKKERELTSSVRISSVNKLRYNFVVKMKKYAH